MKLAGLTKEAKWHNRVAISHAFHLKDLPEAQMEEAYELMKDCGIELISVVQIDGRMPDFKYYVDKGIKLSLGCDGIHDSWNPYWSANVLERALNYCVIYRMKREKELAYAMGLITGGITPVSMAGERQWPKENDSADFLLVDATCSAEVIGRRRPNKAVFFKGNLVYGEI